MDLSSPSSVSSSSSVPDTGGIQGEDGGPSSSTVREGKNTYLSGELKEIAQESFHLLAFVILRQFRSIATLEIKAINLNYQFKLFRI